jgi:hypothetical protein
MTSNEVTECGLWIAVVINIRFYRCEVIDKPKTPSTTGSVGMVGGLWILKAYSIPRRREVCIYI